MSDRKDQNEAGQKSRMQGEKTGDRKLADYGAAEHQRFDVIADQRDGPRDAACHHHDPVGLLIPGEHATGQDHRHGENQQADPDEPLQFVGPLIGPPQIDLGHVQQDKDDHRLCARVSAKPWMSHPKGTSIPK